jgi:predicted GIY-YIG superfamily endonuclease
MAHCSRLNVQQLNINIPILLNKPTINKPQINKSEIVPTIDKSQINKSEIVPTIDKSQINKSGIAPTINKSGIVPTINKPQINISQINKREIIPTINESQINKSGIVPTINKPQINKSGIVPMINKSDQSIVPMINDTASLTQQRLPTILLSSTINKPESSKQQTGHPTIIKKPIINNPESLKQQTGHPTILKKPIINKSTNNRRKKYRKRKTQTIRSPQESTMVKNTSFVKIHDINNLNSFAQSISSLNIVINPETISPHLCYILYSTVSNRIYIGYTNDFPHRIRQHNGEIKGGAKKTKLFRPWKPICTIHGFYDNTSALRFEWRLQHPIKRRRAGEDAINHVIYSLNQVLINGDGSVDKDNKMNWPTLLIKWRINGYKIENKDVINSYTEVC